MNNLKNINIIPEQDEEDDCFSSLEKIISNLDLLPGARKKMLEEITQIFKEYSLDSDYASRTTLDKEGGELYDKHKLYNQFEKALRGDLNINLFCPEGAGFYGRIISLLDKYEPDVDNMPVKNNSRNIIN